jgi:hypothetical protein
VNRNVFKLLLPLALAVMAAGPAAAQVRVGIGFGPLEVHMAPEAPPPMRYERRPVMPGSGYVWVGGNWDRDGDRWAWREGRWDRPPHRGARWIDNRNRREGHSFRHEPGHWSNQRIHEGEGYHSWKRDHRKG